MTKAEKIAKCEKAVVAAAVKWVEFIDDGTVASLYALTRRQERLEQAVTRLQKAVRP